MDTQRPDSFDVSDQTGVLRRRWLIIVGCTAIGLVGALGYIFVAPKTYTAVAAVQVNPTGADQGNTLANSRTSGTVNLDTEAQIVTSGAVAGIAAKTLKSPLTPYQLSKQVAVAVPPNSEVLNISCGASTKIAAAACANAFAAAYLQNRSASAAADLNGQVKALDNNVSSLEKTISGLNAKIGKLPKGSPARAGYASTVFSDKSQVHAFINHIDQLKSQAADVNGGKIITPATPPGKPSSPKKTLILPSGLVAGLLIGLIAAFIWDRRDKTIHRPQDVERMLDLPVLLDLAGSSYGKQVSLASPRSGIGRAFTELGHDVTAALGEGNHVLLVAGASPGPAGSVVAASLAATLARTHPDVVLVCADLSGSVGPKMVGVEDGLGLAEVMAGEASVRDVVRGPSAVPGLWVITPGSDASGQGYYVQYDTAKALIGQLRRDVRYVIIEATGAEDGADTFAFAEFSDAALVVVEVARTHRDEAAECARRLERMRTPVIGVAALPAIGRRVAVRPPRQAGPGARDFQGEVRGGTGDMPVLSAPPNGGTERRGRPVRAARENYSEQAHGN
jgi:capsular polysaccharide biosynthesis protein